jgi:hypothetical protein
MKTALQVPSGDGPSSAGVQGARDDLRLRRVSDDIAVRQISDIDAADQRIGSALERQSGRVEDARRASPVQAERRIGRPNAAEAVVVREAQRVTDAGILDSGRAGVVDAIEPRRAVRTEHLHSAGERTRLTAIAVELGRDNQRGGSAGVDR